MFDEELTGRLARLGDEIEDATVLAPAPAVRNRGDRRRTVAAAAAVAGMTTVAVTAGLAVASMGASPFWTSGPGGPSHATTIPATLVMLHEGENGWWRNDDPRVPGVVNPCLGADATLPGRTDARTLTGPGLATEEAHSPSLVTHQLFLNRDDAATTTLFNKLFTEGAACGWEPGGSALSCGYASGTQARTSRSRTGTGCTKQSWCRTAMRCFWPAVKPRAPACPPTSASRSSPASSS